MKKLICFIFCLWHMLLTMEVIAQELKEEELLKMSFDSLLEYEDNLVYGSNYARKVFDIHILKAKLLNDSLELGRAYRIRVWNESFENAIKFIDSSIHIGEKITNFNLLSRGHYFKGVLLYESDFPKKAIKEYITAYNYALKLENHEYIIDCINSISSLKSEYGQEEEAILLSRKALSYLNKFKDETNNYDLTLLITFDNISRGYLEVKELDSARFFTKKGINLSLKMKDLETFKSLSVLNAQINYYDGSYIKSRDTLQKYIDYSNDYSKADILYYLGMIEGKLDNSEKKKSYFQEIDSLLEKNDFPLLDNVKEIYQFLLKDAIEIDKQKSERKYIKRLIYYDSLLLETENNIRNLTLVEFDIPEQKRVEKSLKEEIESKTERMVIFYAIVILLIILLVIFYLKFLLIKKRFQSVMTKEIKPLSFSPNENTIAQIDIDKDIVENTLESLNKWEEDLGFLEPSTNQNSLAKQLNSNSTYLSRIINVYKQQNFSNYLKDLRITYAINYIKENPQIIENSSTIQLAEKFGFNSLDVFVRTLKRKIGITPAVFFKKIKNSNL